MGGLTVTVDVSSLFLLVIGLLAIGLVTGIAIGWLIVKSRWEEKIRKETIERARATIRGKTMEQLAPLLPSFKYNPSDAKFIGDPVDYVVFDGCSELRDSKSDRPLRIVFVEVKSAKRPTLTRVENAVKDAVSEGRVDYEVLKLEAPE